MDGLHVSPEGSDDGDGSLLHPFATLQRAQLAMQNGQAHITFVAGGVYELDATLRVGPRDSGTTYAAAPNQTPVLKASSGIETLVTLQDAHEVTLAGLTFAGDGEHVLALSLVHADRNLIVGNAFADNNGAVLLSGASRNLIFGNRIISTGATAIEVKDGSNCNRIENNLINGSGAIGTTGGAIDLHGARDNTISHNTVMNTSGMGIGILNWDDDTINTGNTVEYNAVLNANMMSADSGSIYILGRSHQDTRTSINHNFVDGTGQGGDYHTVGIYLDDSTSGVSVGGNVVRGIGSHAVEIHGGDDISVQNNVFDLGTGRASAVLFQSAPPDTAPTNTMRNITVDRNILYSSGTAPVAYDWIDGGGPAIHDNLYWNTTGALPVAVAPASAPLHDGNPVFGDPRFVNATESDYGLGPGSAAARIDFQAVDFWAAGATGVAANGPDQALLLSLLLGVVSMRR